MYCAKTSEVIEMLFKGLTLCVQLIIMLDGGQDRTSSFIAAKGDMSAMRPFASVLWTLVSNYTVKTNVCTDSCKNHFSSRRG